MTLQPFGQYNTKDQIDFMCAFDRYPRGIHLSDLALSKRCDECDGVVIIKVTRVRVITNLSQESFKKITTTIDRLPRLHYCKDCDHLVCDKCIFPIKNRKYCIECYGIGCCYRRVQCQKCNGYQLVRLCMDCHPRINKKWICEICLNIR